MTIKISTYEIYHDPRREGATLLKEIFTCKGKQYDTETSEVIEHVVMFPTAMTVIAVYDTNHFPDPVDTLS